MYRQRAIENALQNIALDQEQSVSSFTVIENGQMLIDQIQSRSSTGVLSYTVSDEKKTNSHYYVTIDAIIRDGIEPDTGKVANLKCRNTTIDAVDYSASINLDLQKLPAWVLISEAWLKNKLRVIILYLACYQQTKKLENIIGYIHMILMTFLMKTIFREIYINF